MTTSSHEVDPTTCDREPIHIPGRIQPHGLLLVLEEPALTVLQASTNVSRASAGTSRRSWAVRWRTCSAPPRGAALREGLANPSLERSPLYLRTVAVAVDGRERAFNAVAHRVDGVLILELEAATSGGEVSFQNLYPLVRTFLAKLEGVATVRELCRLAAAEVRQITGYDRVLIYRFDEDDNGTVVAEDRNDELPSYLDLRFPASDVPRQARELYRVNRLRLVADADAAPVPIVPERDPRTGRPLDLSYATLRSVAPVHAESMKNMGTAASMSISILREGRLWGLISCHHATPRAVPFEVRTACDFLGQVLSLELAAKEHTADLAHRMGLKSCRRRCCPSWPRRRTSSWA
jgi:light-regulated signal transduction histidine kinase (bacteriophytochrome)